MKYLEIVKRLQKLRSNIDVLVLVRSGVFFYGVGKDAVILTEQLGLNYCCMKQGICKCAIPVVKIEEYIEYMLQVILKLPRTEKFNIGNEYKNSMYQMLENVLLIHKTDKSKRSYYLNKIDVTLNYQRICLRIMIKNKWIDEKKFQVAITKIAEIGRITGGLIKYYAKNH